MEVETDSRTPNVRTEDIRIKEDHFGWVKEMNSRQFQNRLDTGGSERLMFKFA